MYACHCIQLLYCQSISYVYIRSSEIVKPQEGAFRRIASIAVLANSSPLYAYSLGVEQSRTHLVLCVHRYTSSLGVNKIFFKEEEKGPTSHLCEDIAKLSVEQHYVFLVLPLFQCVHRDLAARNILINSEFVLKVSDFGLARSLAEEEHYMPISSKCVPIKWIAIESLRDGIYTLESDM